MGKKEEFPIKTYRRAGAFLLLLPLSGCSLKGLALRSTTDLLAAGSSAFYEESDPVLAREALGGQLKLLEALLRNKPVDRRLNLLAAEGFCGYAFLFLEEGQPDRAKAFYLRGRGYGLAALGRRNPLAGLLDLDQESLEKALARAAPRDVPALYWTAFGWGSWVNLSKDSAAAVAELPKAVAVMARVRELSPAFQFAGPELFFGMYYASRPALLGGDLGKAKAHFEEARRLTGGKFLMSYVLEARHLAVAAQDPELFKGLLRQAAQLPAGQLPKARLADEMAKLRAAALMEKTDDYF